MKEASCQEIRVVSFCSTFPNFWTRCWVCWPLSRHWCPCCIRLHFWPSQPSQLTSSIHS